MTTYLESVQRAREVETLPVDEQDAAIVTLLHMFPEQRDQLLLRLIQLVPEEVAAALDELEHHVGAVGELYQAAQARYEIYRAASALPAAADNCNCEHETCAHEYLAVPAGARRAMYVGRICDQCAATCLADYLVDEHSAACVCGECQYQRERAAGLLR